jgi:uncharacterized membrane protein
MELIKLIGIVIIGIIAVIIIVGIVWSSIYDVKIVKNGCKFWAQGISTYGLAGAVAGTFINNFICEILWF